MKVPEETKWTNEEVGRQQHQGMDSLGVQQVPEGSGEHDKIEKNGYKVTSGVPTILGVK